MAPADATGQAKQMVVLAGMVGEWRADVSVDDERAQLEHVVDDVDGGDGGA